MIIASKSEIFLPFASLFESLDLCGGLDLGEKKCAYVAFGIVRYAHRVLSNLTTKTDVKKFW